MGTATWCMGLEYTPLQAIPGGSPFLTQLAAVYLEPRGGAVGPTQRSCVYLVSQGTTWSSKNRSMKGIFD